MLRPEPRRYAARLALVGPTVQLRAAPLTPTLVRGVRDLPVKPQQQFVKSLIRQYVLYPLIMPFSVSLGETSPHDDQDEDRT